MFKVWDVVSGNRYFTFEGHDAPVYSVCPHTKENIHVMVTLAMMLLFNHLMNLFTVYDVTLFCTSWCSLSFQRQ